MEKHFSWELYRRHHPENRQLQKIPCFPQDALLRFIKKKRFCDFGYFDVFAPHFLILIFSQNPRFGNAQS